MKRLSALLIAGLLFASIPCKSVEHVKVPKESKIKLEQVFSSKSLKNVDKVMERAIQKEAVPSAVCLVKYKGKTVYYKAFGKADRASGKPLRKDAIFRNASQTKLITTVALMTLYEEGLFSLDDPVKKYLPEFSNPVVRVSGSYEGGDLVTRPAKREITIRQLLSHSSGISYDPYDQDVRVICYNYADSTINTEEIVKRIAKLPLRHDPGEGFTYGFGLDVAGRLAEVISGKRLDELIKERVLDPLNMKDSYFYLPKAKAKRLVPLYQKPTAEDSVTLAADSLERFYPLSPIQNYFGGGAGISGTIEDYSHLCEMILNKGVYGKTRILSRKTVEQMSSDQLFGAAGDYQFGLGLEIATDKTAALTMKSPGSLRWGGYYGTEYLIDPKEDLVILFYTNRVSWYNNSAWGDFMRAVYMSLY
ncbi:MAG: serine hydrolase domain-containing protein [Bacteroidota bacterium]|nr:serine hydrolase domain-containing protein [Bacteroidota bacterium]